MPRLQKKKSNKGILIKGMSERLPIGLLDEPAFRKGLKRIMAGYAGIYVLYSGKRLYYIGLATNLFWRLHSHRRHRHKGRWNHFSIFRIGRVRYLKDIETLLLRVALPKGNKVTGHLRKDADLKREIRNIAREESRKMHKINKIIG